MMTETTESRLNGASKGFEFRRQQLVELAKVIGDEIDTIRPIEDKPAYMIAQTGALLRDYFKSKGLRPELTLHTNGAVYVSRASNLALEAICGLHCYYLIFPGPIEANNVASIERAAQAHYLSLKKFLTPEWDCTFIPVLRQPITESKFPESLRVFVAGQIHYCGDYVCADERDPNFRLYICGVRVDGNSTTQPLVGI